MRNPLILIAATMAIVASARAQGASSQDPAKRPEVLVLGVYHMANPGQDIFNLQADNVLASKRQQEMGELAAVLAKFKPTKIAIEHDAQSRLTERYTKYLAGQYVLTANENDQIGLRLAKELGHPTIYAVDADGEFPYPRIDKYAKATGQSAKLARIMEGGWGAMTKTLDEYLKAHTVVEALVWMNADARVAQDVGYYYLLARFGEPYDYAGPDLLAEWYRRNLRIYNNVTKLLAAPEERVLVIFGAGHLGWLRQAFGADPTLRLRTLDEFVPTASGGPRRP